MSKTIVFRLVFVGNSLLFIFVFIVLFDIIPVKLFQPQWLLGFSDTVLSTSGFSLVALIFLALAAYLDPDNFSVSAHVKRTLRLACLAAFGFLLLIPLQFYTAHKLLAGFREQHVGQINQTINKAIFLAQKVRESDTFDQLQGVMKTYQAIQLPEQERSRPLSVIKNDLLGKIQEAVLLLKNNRNMNIVTQKAWEIYQVAIRNSLLSLAYFLAFAALGQRRDSQRSFLQDLMDSWLNRLYAGLQNRESRVALAAEQNSVQFHSPPLSGSSNLSNLQRQGLMDQGWLDDESHQDSSPEALLPRLNNDDFSESLQPTNPARRHGLFSWFRPGERRRQDEATSFLETLADQQNVESFDSSDFQNPQDISVRPSLPEQEIPAGTTRPVPPSSRRQKITDLDYFEQLADENHDSSSPANPGGNTANHS